MPLLYRAAGDPNRDRMCQAECAIATMRSRGLGLLTFPSLLQKGTDKHEGFTLAPLEGSCAHKRMVPRSRQPSSTPHAGGLTFSSTLILICVSWNQPDPSRNVLTFPFAFTTKAHYDTHTSQDAHPSWNDA